MEIECRFHIALSLGSAVGQESIKYILFEIVSYLAEGGVLCVGNG